VNAHTPISPEHEQPICTQEAARAAGLDIAPTPAELTVCAESIVRTWGDRTAEPSDEVASTADAGAQLARALPLLLAELDRARARAAELEAAPQTVYRASHESIVMGLYTTRKAAREHCETVLRREVGDEAFLGWVPDDGSELAAEELCIGHDFECSGYVVTPLEVASAYDEEADE